MFLIFIAIAVVLWLYGVVSYCFHNVCRRAPVHQLVLHEVHVWGHMTEEFMISCTKVVQPRLPVGCACKTVLGTFAVAGKQPFAFLALSGE